MDFNHTQLAYLDALGIDVWMPRDALALQADTAANEVAGERDFAANALTGTQAPQQKPSGRAAALQQANALLNGPAANVQGLPAHGATVRQDSQPNPRQAFQADPRQAFQADLAQQQPSGSVQFPQPSQPLQPSVQQAMPPVGLAEQTVPQFHLQFWCYRSGFWFVSALYGLEPRHHKFVHNLALYLQGPSQQRAQKPKHVGIFSWPMLDAPNIDQGESVAKHYLQQHIAQLQQMSPCDTLIALDESHQWLSEHDPVCLDTQLDNCLISISEKQRVWRLLQPHRLL